jgi:hypothetical protein
MKRVAMALGILALAGCGSEKSGTIETEDGTVDYTVDNDGSDASITIRNEEGEVTIAGGSGKKVDLPEGFSLYPGASVINSSSVSHAEGSGVRLAMSTQASPIQVIEFYRKQAKAAGIEIMSEITAGGQIMVGGKGDDGTDFSVTASGGEAGTTVNLMVSKGF